MSLSCSCDWDDDPAWYYGDASDYKELSTKRSRRCSSCKAKIKVGDTVISFARWREPRNEIEERIYGEYGEIELSDLYLCEKCADLYLSLDELGFECVSPTENMLELVKEYAREYGRNENE